jgi:hypothetical protein
VLRFSQSFKLFDLIATYSPNQSTLVFCTSRKGCSQAAQAVGTALLAFADR